MWGLDLSQSLQGAGGIGGLLCVSDATASYYYLYDANGNVTQLVNEGGAVVAHYEYDPFGNLTAKSGVYADANPFRHATQYFDDEISLYAYKFRYYSPELGRWTSRDPIGEQGGANLYAFCLNSALMYIDALGQDYMKAFSNWIAGGANERVGTLKQKRMWGKETRRIGIEFPHFFQTELSRLENEGYTVECFPDELMDAIYLEVRDYWRFEAMMNALGISLSQVFKYINLKFSPKSVIPL